MRGSSAVSADSAELVDNGEKRPATGNKERASAAFTLRQRLLLWLISGLGYWAIRLIAPTLRFDCDSTEEDEMLGGPPRIWVFWHRCVFPSAYRFRNRQIAVMTSSSFDGEYIARIIEAFGFRAVRGSSTRGGVRALLGMHTEIEQGRHVAFTIDGPLGPKYVAKPGPVLLARNTQSPVVPFYIALDKPWTLNSWDQFMIPKPFSRAILRFGEPIHVPPDADSATMQGLHAQMQAGLEQITAQAEQALTGPC